MSLSIKNLNVILQKEKILHGISLDIMDGEFVSLLGASGCGKSTFLKSIAGLIPVESGEICINNQVINEVPPEKRGTVIVFQDLRLFPNMTVEKNIAFSMNLKKTSKEQQEIMVQKLLKEVQLLGYEKRRIKEMSGGQLQRVALARAIAAEPKILLLDEPFSGLNESLRAEMSEMVQKFHKEKRLTTVLVTHDRQEALRMSDRIALMSKGCILQYDTPQEIFRHPHDREVAEYFGRMNYIKVGKKEIGVRPFDIHILPGKGECVVRDIVFLGETAEITLDTPKGTVVCSMSDRVRGILGIRVGSRVEMKINGKKAVEFER